MRAENGCTGWIRTSILPFNKRADYCCPTVQRKLVSAAGVAPAITRAQAEHVATTLRAEAPGEFKKRRSGETRAETLGIGPR